MALQERNVQFSTAQTSEAPPRSGCPFNHSAVTDMRFPLGPEVVQLQRYGYRGEDQRDYDALHADLSPADRYKIEIYKLSAALIPTVMKNAKVLRDNNQPYGLILPHYDTHGKIRSDYPRMALTRIENSHPFGQLQEAMISTLLLAVMDSRDDFETHASPKLRSLNSRFSEILEENSPFAKDSNIYELLARGCVTAAEVSAKVLGTIPLVAQRYSRDTSAEALLNIAKNSYPFVRDLTKCNVNYFSFVMNRLREGPYQKYVHTTFSDYPLFDPDHFTITPPDASGGERLVFTDKFVEETAILYRSQQERSQDVTLSCPALHAGVVLDLWEWSTTIGGKIYEQQATRQNVLENVA